MADIQTVSLVTAALAGKRFRATVGEEWKVASFVVDRMTKARKCRAADDLLLTADAHPLYREARMELATQTPTELVRIATGDAALPVRALATWFAVAGPTPGKQGIYAPGEASQPPSSMNSPRLAFLPPTLRSRERDFGRSGSRFAPSLPF